LAKSLEGRAIPENTQRLAYCNELTSLQENIDVLARKAIGDGKKGMKWNRYPMFPSSSNHPETSTENTN